MVTLSYFIIFLLPILHGSSAYGVVAISGMIGWNVGTAVMLGIALKGIIQVLFLQTILYINQTSLTKIIKTEKVDSTLPIHRCLNCRNCGNHSDVSVHHVCSRSLLDVSTTVNSCM